MSKELIGKIRDELSDGGVMVAPYWAELLKESAQTLESQAREIERLQLTCNDIDDQNDRIYAELAALKAQPDPWKASGADWCSSIHSNPDAMAWADFFVAVFPGQADKHELMFGWFANAMMAMHDHLKAQPSGVVLPERKTWNQVTGREGFIETEAHNACLDEVARLNSSPVSAGDPEKCSYQDDPRSPAELSLAGCNCVRFGEGNPHWPCKLHTPVSAGEIPFAGFDPNFCPGSNPENPQEPDDDQAYDRNAERLTAEVFGVGAGINHSATSIDDLFTDAGGVDERADLEKRTHDILIRCLNHPHTFRHQIVSDDELCDVIEARTANQRLEGEVARYKRLYELELSRAQAAESELSRYQIDAALAGKGGE